MALLVGTTTIGGSGASPNYVIFTKFTASATGNAIKIRLYAGVNGNAKVAIYSDSGGSPSNLLVSASSACTSGQWNDITVSSTTISNGTVYHLGINTDTDGLTVTFVGGERRYKAATYSSYTFPATYDGTGFTTDANTHSISGDGSDIISKNKAYIIL